MPRARRSNVARTAWVSYTRVSTTEQAERDLSLPAQRHAIAEYAARHGAQITREYVEAGSSGSDPHRRELRRMIGDVLAPGSDIGVIVVHHTSRFMRDAAEARMLKKALRNVGVRVLSASQEIHDDPMGKFIEGVFELVDQYESDINGARTSAAMAEAVRQGFYPSGISPFGYAREKVELRPGVVRYRLVPDPSEAPIVRELFELYIAKNGSKSVARELNRRGHRHRNRPWSTNSVLYVLQNSAVVGSLIWRRHSTRAKAEQPESQWVELRVEPIIERELFDLAQEIRKSRDPSKAPGRASSSEEHALGGLLRCGKCGASYQLEGSGKTVPGTRYTYSYYNCRTTVRTGKESCPGYRIRCEFLDRAVLASLVDTVCAPERVEALRAQLRVRGEPALIANAWRTLITTDAQIARNYLRHLVERIMVHENRIVLVPRVPHCADAEATD